MIGKTNAQTSGGSGGIKGEKINISLVTNQSSHEDLKGVIVTVAYATESEKYTWNGSVITVEIPPYLDYSVSVSDVEGYSTPAKFTSNAIPENAKSVELKYNTEVVHVTLSADDGASMAGQTVTINGTEHTFDGNAVEQKVAYGVTYTVSVSDKDGYAAPNAQTFTAAQSGRNLELVYIASALKVNILSNQENDENIAAVKAIVTYGDTSVEVSNGQQIGIPTNVEVTITFPEVEMYKTPDAISFTNSNGGVAEKTGTYYTEAVYISTFADEGTPTGFVTTVTASDGSVLGSFTTDMGILGIPSGTTYTVSCSDVDGYTTPSPQTFTAASITNARNDVAMGYQIIKAETLTVNVNADDGASVDGQNVTVKKNIANGVYIQDIEGGLWKESAWDGSKTPNGVAVVSDNCSFVMALTPSPSLTVNFGSGVPSGVVLTTDLSTAITDYNGESNTVKFVESYGADIAPNYCKIYTFPNGQRGYMGAAGEWEVARIYAADIHTAMNKCGGTGIGHSFWTSTQYSDTSMWVAYMNANYISPSSRDNSGIFVRAFASLEIFRDTQPVSNGKATFTIPYDTEYTVSVDEKSGYTSPASQTYTASQATRSITMTYEAPKVENLIVNVTSSDGSSTDGQVVTISDVEYLDSNSKYVRLEYIESTGSQYIDTGYKPGGKTNVEGYFEVLSSTSGFLFGARSNSSANSSSYSFSCASINGQSIRSDYGANETTLDFNPLQKFFLEKNMGTTRIGISVMESVTDLEFSTPYNLALFAVNTAGTIGVHAVARLYSCQIYDDGTLVRDYTPALNANGIAGLYDAVNDTFYPSSGGGNFVPGRLAIESQTVSNGKASFTIPVGTTYEVSVSSRDSYITPASKTYTAASGSRTVTMNYVYHAGTTNPTNGVYIQDTDGFCHTADAWTGTYTPNGIAVITDNCRFVMALVDDYSSGLQWGGYGTEVSGIATTTSSSTAATDYAGEANTTTIINALNGTNDGYVDGAPAAEYCRAYTFPNGVNGYLGSAGEWKAALDNKAAIVSALSKCGGTAINLYYWTSTQYSSTYSWFLRWSSESLDHDRKYGYSLVRAFTSL